MAIISFLCKHHYFGFNFRVRKGFKCHCGKSYKTGQGLKNHTTIHHNGVNLATLTTQTGEIIQIPSSRVAALQPLRTVTLKQISAASLNALGLPIKAIQGIVVATKQSETFDARPVSFVKGTPVQIAVPNVVSKGLLNHIVSSKLPPEQTITSTLGVLTPATSPQTLPPESPSMKIPLAVTVPFPALADAPVSAVEVGSTTALQTSPTTNYLSGTAGGTTEISSITNITARSTL